jgi:BirA family biotin operon repressor/biotin-[acetyl-CoA-carboxylase] ligase
MSRFVQGDISHALAALLADRQTHSGETIARQLGCSRTAVWKHVERLRAHGIEIDAVAGQGYRMREPLDLLNQAAILDALDPEAAAALGSLHIAGVVDSTNDWLLALPPGQRHGMALLAERQTAGRGRRGRSWVSPYARNLYLSLGWTFESGAAQLGCLPLLVALAACDALDRAGLEGHGVKWPNDLLLDGRKLGGCLVEIQGDASGPCHAVMGIGINLRMPESLLEAQGINQPWADLGDALPGLSRNRMASLLLGAMLVRVGLFAQTGFAPLREAWQQRDALAGLEVELQHATGAVRGRVLGISDYGALRLQLPSGTAEYTAGEVKVQLRHRDS